MAQIAPHIDRYTPADTNGGWGFASAVIVLTIALIVGVTVIHKNTYKHPTDPSWHGKGSGDAAPPGQGSTGQ